jgi:O-antigen/teichoic acid export membrane protein
MAYGRRIMKATGVQVLGKIASIALGVIAIAIITRHLGRTGYGQYATIMAYLQLFGIAVDLGLNVIAPSELGRLKHQQGSEKADGDVLGRVSASRLLGNIFGMRLCAALVMFTIAASVAWFIPVYSTGVRLGIALASFSFLGIVLTQILHAPFQVDAEMRWPMAAEVIGRVVLVSGVAWAAASGYGLIAIVGATVIGNVLAFIIVFIAVQRIVRVRPAFDFVMWRRILAKSWPIGLSIVFNLVYLRADTVLLSFMKPAEDVGIYAAPYRLLDVLTQFPHLVMGLVLPLLAASWASGDRSVFLGRLQRAFEGLALLGLPLVFGAVALGTPMMRLVAGPAFEVSGPVLAVLALGLLGIFLGQPFGYAIVAIEKQRTMLTGYAIVAAVTLIGYLLFIPRFSYWGAAWMTVASEIAIALMTFIVVRRTSGLRLRWGVPASAFVASIVMVAVLMATPMHVLPRIGLGAVVYGLMVVALPATRRVFRAALAL